MSAVDLDRLLAEISQEAPSGEQDLAYDPAFVELEEKTKGTPEHEFDGKIVQEAKDPDWSEVRDAAVELLTSTHDLRVAMYFTRAMLHTEGFNGLRTGLDLLRGFIERYWETLYPILDPEDNNDPTQRINILAALCEMEEFIGPLTRTNLCVSRAVGQFSLRDIHIANGKIEPTKDDKSPAPTKKMIDAAFKDCDVEDLQATQTAINTSLQNLDGLVAILEEKVGDAGSAYDFGDLKKVLKKMNDVLENQLAGRSGTEPSETKPTSDTDVSSDTHSADTVSTQRGNPMDAINTRQDVIRALDKICTYYQSNEPGSPVPLLLKRARQLVEKNFFEIMQDLGLDSATQIKTLFNGGADDTS